MKVVKSAPHYTETALDEIKLLRSVRCGLHVARARVCVLHERVCVLHERVCVLHAYVRVIWKRRRGCFHRSVLLFSRSGNRTLRT